MRRLCVAVAIVLGVLLPTRSIHAQRPRPGDSFRAIPDAFAPTEILNRLTALIGQRDYRRYNPFGAPDAADNYTASVWRALDVPDRWNGHCPSCESRLLDAMAPTRFVVLRIQMADWQYRFIVFVAPENTDPGWRFAGYADTDAKYDVPGYRLDAIPGHSFLVVEHDTGGTGIYERGDAWHELSPNAKGSVALDLPTQGHDEFVMTRSRTYVLTHEWESKVVPGPDRVAFHVALTAHYSWYGEQDSNELFERHQSAAFVWDAAAGEFKFDRSRSDLSEQEFHDVYRGEGLNVDTFARYNAAYVNRIFDQGPVEAQRAFAALGVKRAAQ